MTLSVLIADDERPARANIQRLLSTDPRFEVVAEASDGFAALEKLRALRPDIVFLDVQMPGLDGFEVLDALGDNRRLAVVFSTAHDAHALRAFDAHAVDYLLKPYAPARFLAALEKAVRQLASGERLLIVRTDEGFLALDQSEVVRVSAEGKHVVVTASARTLRVRHTLSGMLEKLDPERFVRVHRGEVVNLSRVVRYETTAHGDGVLTLADGSAVPLSRSYRAAFSARFERGA